MHIWYYLFFYSHPTRYQLCILFFCMAWSISHSIVNRAHATAYGVSKNGGHGYGIVPTQLRSSEIRILKQKLNWHNAFKTIFVFLQIKLITRNNFYKKLKNIRFSKISSEIPKPFTITHIISLFCMSIQTVSQRHRPFISSHISRYFRIIFTSLISDLINHRSIPRSNAHLSSL